MFMFLSFCSFLFFSSFFFSSFFLSFLLVLDKVVIDGAGSSGYNLVYTKVMVYVEIWRIHLSM